MCRISKAEVIKSVKDKLEWPQKFFFCVDLKIGLNVWLALESAFWFILFLIVLYHQISYFSAIDLRDFGSACKDSYFRFVFGGFASSVDHKRRLTITIVHLVLLVVVLAYFLSCLVLLIAVNKIKLRCFYPYFITEALAACLLVVSVSGVIYEPPLNQIIALVVFLLIKFYVEVCLISLYKNFQSQIKATARTEMAKFLGESKRLFVKA